jgi:hypothetical protein
MIKSVLQTITSYTMGVYLISNSIINDIEKTLKKNWWVGSSNNKGIRWLAWDRLAKPKSQGGLSFYDFHAFNKAIIY